VAAAQTITCEFSRFDNPSDLQLVNIPIGTKRWCNCHDHYNRSIGQFSAENFNDAFSEKLFFAQANIPIKLYEYQKTAIQTALQM
jgi:hypothetical protein